MGGRLEKENQAKDKMDAKLSDLPEIFTAFYNWMDARDKSYTTMDNYINHVVEFMNFFVQKNGKGKKEFYKYVTDTDIEKYMAFIRRKNINGEEVLVGDDIRAAKWSSLNAFFKFLSQKRHIDSNPMLSTERPRVKTQHTVTYLTPKEIESVFVRIRQESRERTKNRDACIVALGLTTGLRVSAIVNIDISDIDFKTRTIRVIEKGRKTRDIPFSDNLKNFLILWIADRESYFDGGDNGPLFLSQMRKRMSVDSVQDIVKKYTKHLDKHITPHKLRSSAAMNLHGAGVDILTIASILGHENVTTTQRYTRAYDEDKQNATNILDNLI